MNANAVPWLGFGTGDLVDALGESEAENVLNAAFEAGFRYFDTARLYGSGDTEKVIGRCFQKRRGKVVITTKAGILPWKDLRARRFLNKGRAALGFKQKPVENVFNAFALDQLKSSLNRSLKYLKTDYIDILLLHECSLETVLRDEIIDWAETLKKEGKIRSFGTAARRLETLDIIDAKPSGIDIVQFETNPLHTSSNVANEPQFQYVTHSALALTLPIVKEFVTQHTDQVHALSTKIGWDIRDLSHVAAHFLLFAHHQNHRSPVLFSTKQPHRINDLVRRIESLSEYDLNGLTAIRSALAAHTATNV